MDILFAELEEESYHFKCWLNGTKVFILSSSDLRMLIVLWLHVRLSLMIVRMSPRATGSNVCEQKFAFKLTVSLMLTFWSFRDHIIYCINWNNMGLEILEEERWDLWCGCRVEDAEWFHSYKEHFGNSFHGSTLTFYMNLTWSL